MKPAKISVILPTRNRAAMVTDAIDSALEQGIEDMEIIVIDDASEDGTATRLARYGDKIRLVQLPQCKGVAHARNQGIAIAQGQWLAFLDSDDLWLPGKLAAQLELLEQRDEIVLCFCDFAVEQQDENGYWQEVAVYGRRPGPRDFAALFRRNFIGTLTVLLRRDLCLAVGGFDESLHRGSDYDLWLRVAQVAPIQRLPAVYARYRRHAHSLTGLDSQRDQKTYAEITAAWIDRDPELLSRINWSMHDWRNATQELVGS